MPFGNAVSGPAFGVLNELLGIVRGTDGIARQTRYEVLFLPPSGGRGTRNAPTNAMAAEEADNGFGADPEAAQEGSSAGSYEYYDNNNRQHASARPGTSREHADGDDGDDYYEYEWVA